MVPDEANSFIEAETRVAHGRGRLQRPAAAGVVVDDVQTDKGGRSIRDYEWRGEVGAESVLTAAAAARGCGFVKACVDVHEGDVHTKGSRHLKACIQEERRRSFVKTDKNKFIISGVSFNTSKNICK